MNLDRKKVDTNLGEIDIVTLKSDDMEVILTSYGAAIYQIYVFGHLVTVAPMQFDDFFRSPFYYGKTVGRTSGRISLPSYQIDHQYYPISAHGGKNVKLHGGPKGFSYRHFKFLSKKIDENEISVSFVYTSKHMEEEYPGELRLVVTYTLNNKMGLKISYEAKSDKDTLCNLTNHTYFNLSQMSNDILNHDIKINAFKYIEINEDLTFKEIKACKNTPFDFNLSKNLGDQIKLMRQTSFNGYDHTWIFNDEKIKIEVDEPSSPVKLLVQTSYPSLVMYTHNHPSPTKLEQFKHDGTYSSFTLECQYEPDGIHHEGLHPAILRKNELYQEYILYQFVEK